MIFQWMFIHWFFSGAVSIVILAGALVSFLISVVITGARTGVEI